MATGQLHRDERVPAPSPVALAQSISPYSLSVAAVLAGGLLGVATASKVSIGFAALLAALFVPLALINLRVAFVVWIPLVFAEGVPSLNLAGKAAGLVLVAAWLGALRGERAKVGGMVRRHYGLLVAIALFLVWLTLSLAWAANSAAGAADLWHWYAVAVLFVIAATVAAGRSAVRAVAGAFAVGATMSVVVGLIHPGLVPVEVFNVTAVGPVRRLLGLEGDPNSLAAVLIPAILIAAAFVSSTRTMLVRWLLLVALALMVGGLVASQSRGGLLAAAVAVAAALVVFRRQRGAVLAGVVATVSIGALVLSLTPGSFQRLTSFNSGTGRTDLWTVAWRMAKHHPIAGVGLNNYEDVAPRYVRQPGPLPHFYIISEHTHVGVHNTYLQFFAETGIVGLTLFLLIAVGCLRAMSLAARRFAARGDGSMATLSRAVLVGTIGTLAASVFLTYGVDQRVWILFALGPALLAAATNGRVDGDPARVSRFRAANRSRYMSPAEEPGS